MMNIEAALRQFYERTDNHLYIQQMKEQLERNKQSIVIKLAKSKIKNDYISIRIVY